MAKAKKTKKVKVKWKMAYVCPVCNLAFVQGVKIAVDDGYAKHLGCIKKTYEKHKKHEKPR